MRQPDRIEFYLGNDRNPFFSMPSSMQPVDGDLVVIRGVTYKVLGRSYTVDHADGPYDERQIRCNVIVEPMEGL